MKPAALLLAVAATAAVVSASAASASASASAPSAVRVPIGMRRGAVPYSLPSAVTGRYEPLMHTRENERVRARVGDDPADSWMAYAVSKGNGQLLTLVNATWKVPSNPTEMDEGNAPGWWYGIEPAPASDLIQPILAWGYGDVSYTIFNGYYQWDNDEWWFSAQGTVLPGQTVTASVWYEASNSSYAMTIGCVESGWSVFSSIPIETGKLYTDTYFVFEHQPDDCQQLPANGKLTFTDIAIALNDQPVADPKWQALQYQPACDSNAQVVSASALSFTWQTQMQTQMQTQTQQ